MSAQSVRLEEVYDSRYPRPLWFCNLRQLLIDISGLSILVWFLYWWGFILVLSLIACLVGTIYNLCAHGIVSLSHIDFKTLFSPQIILMLPFNQILTLYWWGHNWGIAVLIAIFVTIMGFGCPGTLSEWATNDESCERRELDERQPPPPGFALRYSRRMDKGIIKQIAWPNLGFEKTSYLERMDKGIIKQIAWSPDGQTLALDSYLERMDKGIIKQIAWWYLDVQTLPSPKTNAVLLWKLETGELMGMITDTYPLSDKQFSKVEIRSWNRTARMRSRTSNSIMWSPDGDTLAWVDGSSLSLWNIKTRQWYKRLNITSYLGGDLACTVTWLPDGLMLASTSSDGNIMLWDVKKEQQVQTLLLWDAKREERPQSYASRTQFTITWSPDGQVLAAASDADIQLWDTKSQQFLPPLRSARGYGGPSIRSIVWSPDGQTLASYDGRSIVLWDTNTGRMKCSLEGFLSLTCLSFSSDSRLLAIKDNNSIRVLQTNTGETVADLYSYSTSPTGVAFHPTEASILATLGRDDTIIRIWDLDLSTLLGDFATSALPTEQIPSRSADTGPVDPIPIPIPIRIPTPPITRVRYTNAKVILVGNSGVGKSGLKRVLSQKPFAETDSTHGRHVSILESQEIELSTGQKETRETLLWDTAGQPGYRLIHQLHLNEVTVALVVFDASSETDPFAGVQHWDRALRSAQCTQGNTALPMKKFLVAARIDRGGIGVSRTRIDSLVQTLGFDGYFETSAKERKGIELLKKAILQAIDWEKLPWVISTELFQHIRSFLMVEKEAGRLLSTVDDLYRTFLRTENASAETEKLRSQFEVCVSRVESRGLIRRLSFGNLILLQPELLDAYASALVNAVKDEPDSWGSITEERVLTVKFAMPENERIKDREQEKVLMIAMVEDLLRYEIALREQTEDGPHLVFPSQSTREQPDLPDPKGKAVVFSFEGPVQNVYATLAVRLSYSGLFKKKELWKNAINYTASSGGTCGILLDNAGEGQGKLTLFFDKTVSEEMRSHFENYVESHLRRRALPESVKRRRVIVCNNDNCFTVVDEEAVQKRLKLGRNWLSCPVCDKPVSLVEHEQQLTAAPSLSTREMDQAVDIQREREATQLMLQGKIEKGDFDVFLCHNGQDKPAVKQIGEQLKKRGILPWLDEWELPPGRSWLDLLEKQIGQIKAAAVFVGKNGLGPWQQEELKAFLREFVDRGCPVIPVLLANAPQKPVLPMFLKAMTWVDFRVQDPDPMQRLLWGITGRREVDE